MTPERKRATKEYRKRNPELLRRWKRDYYARQGELRAQRKLALLKLRGNQCVDCGESDSIVLQFDHRDPFSKTFSIGTWIHSKKWEILVEEAMKCDIRCANCHVRRTIREGHGQFHRGREIDGRREVARHFLSAGSV